MSNMKYKVGNRVRIKNIDWYNKNKDKDGRVACGYHTFTEEMSKFCGQTMIICKRTNLGVMTMGGNANYWTDEMIEGLVEENMGEVSDGYHTFSELYEYRLLYNASFFNELAKQNLYDVHKSKKHSDGEDCFGGGHFIVMAELPTGQVSNHYELKDWNLFQVPEKEKANKWDGHTPQDVAKRMRKFLTPKPKYPKTYEECCKVLFPNSIELGKVLTSGYNCELLKKFGELLICRNAYWKIAGEEMGLDKPWEPDWEGEGWYVIVNHKGKIIPQIQWCANAILAFPTEEMRDAFYENFKELIKHCKELL